jgi:ferredoxin
MYRIPATSLDALLAAIAEQAKLYLPVDNGDQANYTEWSEGVKFSNRLNTLRSAKDFFFPQTQNLMDFKINGKFIEVIDNRKESEDFVLFGVRACDAASFDILDKVFLAEPVDTYYKTRREHSIIMTLACNKPEETCFCAAFGIDVTNPGGDISCWMANNFLYLDPKTEKGSTLINKLGAIVESCDNSGADEVKTEIKNILNVLPLADLKPADLTDKQLETFKSEKWAALSQACLGCGSCTFVCPTCQCYDIKDFDTGCGIKRIRTWDSCMYSDFTKMAHGNPRLTQLERFRQRFMHKLVYFPQNNEGVYGCVGCGRCLRQCPISMNIVKVMKTLGGEQK